MENFPTGHYIPVEHAIHTMNALLRPIRRRYHHLYWAESPDWVAVELRKCADEDGQARFNDAILLLLRATDPTIKPNINRGMNAVHNLFRNLASNADKYS